MSLVEASEAHTTRNLHITDGPRPRIDELPTDLAAVNERGKLKLIPRELPTNL